MSGLARRHVLDLDDFSPDEIGQVLDTAVEMREILRRPIKRVPALRGKTVVNMFYEASTRTRVSFELAGKNLSADVVNVSASGSSVEKGESIVDTIQTLEALGADTIVIRHSQSGTPYLAAAHTTASIINAGDGAHEHPTQALLDCLTLRQELKRESFDGLRVAYVGDFAHSRVARSGVHAFTKLGAEVTLVAPPTMLPHCMSPWNVQVSHDLDDVLPKVDVLYTIRPQRERINEALFPSLDEYITMYGITDHRFARLDSTRPGSPRRPARARAALRTCGWRAAGCSPIRWSP